jgi:hypothetical protein
MVNLATAIHSTFDIQKAADEDSRIHCSLSRNNKQATVAKSWMNVLEYCVGDLIIDLPILVPSNARWTVRMNRSRLPPD